LRRTPRVRRQGAARAAPAGASGRSVGECRTSSPRSLLTAGPRHRRRGQAGPRQVTTAISSRPPRGGSAASLVLIVFVDVDPELLFEHVSDGRFQVELVGPQLDLLVVLLLVDRRVL